MSIKTVQEEIEKTLANSLRNRFLDQNETIYTDFDQRDIEKLKGNELYFRLFIRARQGDLEKAYSMMVECLKWRKSYKMNDVTEENLDEEVLKQGLLYYRNVDKKNQPILIFHGNKYPFKKEEKKAQELGKLFAYLLEKQQKWCLGKQLLVICDHHDASLSNMDLDFFKFIVNLISIYYPHILDSFIVLDVSWRLSAVWKVIKNWLSSDMSTRFKFIDRSKLTDYVDKSKVVVSMGGEDSFEYTWPPLPDNAHDDHEQTGESSNNELESHEFEEVFSREDLNTGHEEAAEIGVADEKEPSFLPEEKNDSHMVGTAMTMGGSLGTHVRNRFRGHQVVMEENPSSDLHLEHGVLIVRPSDEISFREKENENEVQETIMLKNISENTVIFKIKTNSPGNFRVRPSVGALVPGSSKEITLMLLLKGDAIQEKHHYGKDKLLILYTETTEEITSATDITELWKNVPKIDTREHRLSCRVLDVNGLEKRPKTVEDVIDMSLKLRQQMLDLETKVEKFGDSNQQMINSLQQQRLILFVILGFILLLCVVCLFR